MKTITVQDVKQWLELKLTPGQLAKADAELLKRYKRMGYLLGVKKLKKLNQYPEFYRSTIEEKLKKMTK